MCFMKILRNVRNFYEYTDCEKKLHRKSAHPRIWLQLILFGLNTGNVPFFFSHTFTFYPFNQA